ncbi:MAG: glycosyltransferase, partial [Bacteroidetes bacterium]|nr:glycosyltransferase [Bacteroidota bacterium]
MRTVSLIILNWNGWENINKCLNSVNKLIINTYDLQTIVVDNGSTDNSVKKIKNFFPKITLLENKKNLGYASGNNIGIRYALNKNSDFLFILNNDTLLHPKVIEEILATYQRTSASVISPKIYFTAGCEFHKLRYKPSDWGRVIWY